MGNKGGVAGVFGGCIPLDEMKHLKLENYINDGHFLASRREFIERDTKKILAL
ncbi:hypothetical protein [Peribacillus frigoritolerans]|uniref:hypothetical protein n=1 Tax=Peribacillus frigoritolerans TaxID=450367 RepID=UPI00207999BD|nr:hypothetical protein [Peribacillus frigoritolerans]USK75930.1 hypothetical protein LIT31_05010 [Peribacillus frigoritolerans]